MKRQKKIIGQPGAHDGGIVWTRSVIFRKIEEAYICIILHERLHGEYFVEFRVNNPQRWITEISEVMGGGLEKERERNFKETGFRETNYARNKREIMETEGKRLRKLAGIISEQLNLNKEKIEIASSICKADLVSDLVGEYPELQGVMGRYFAIEQGFEEDVSIAISDHYLPTGINSDIPKKPISIAVSLIDKIDILVGFFGINEKPTSSKDPFALRRTAIGLLRIIIENKLSVKLKDLINYSIVIYEEQNTKFTNNSVTKEVLIFLRERFKKNRFHRLAWVISADAANCL